MTDDDETDPGRRALGRWLAALGGAAVAGVVVDPNDAVAQSVGTAGATARVAPSIAMLRAMTTPRGDGDVVVVLGSAAPGDGGEGLFVWSRGDGAHPPRDDGGIVVVPRGEAAGAWRRAQRGAVNVRWFASLATTGDWTLALRAAVRAAVRAALQRGPDGPPRAVHLPSGNYVVRGTIQLPESGMHLRGDGPEATNVQFQPGHPGEAVLFDVTARNARREPDATTLLWPDDPTPGRIASASVEALSCTSIAGDAATKIAVRVNDGDGVHVRDLRVGTFWSTGGAVWQPGDASPLAHGAPSVGVEVLAGQLCVVRDVHVIADAPMRIGPAAIDRAMTPATGGMCDHLHLCGLHLGPHPSEAGVRVLPGVAVTNLLLDGENSISGGSFGIHWDRGGRAAYPDATSGSAVLHANVVIRNLRVETLVGHGAGTLPAHEARRHSLWFGGGDGRVPLRNVVLENIACATAVDGSGADPDGLFARHVEQLTMTACVFPSTHAVSRHLDVDDTCTEIEWRNCYFGSQGAAGLDAGGESSTGIGPGLVGVALGTRAARSALSPLPSSATYVRSRDGGAGMDRATASFGVWTVRYRGLVGVGEAHAFRIPALAGWTRKFGTLTLAARDPATDALEGGAWLFSRASIRAMHRTPNAAPGGAVGPGRIGIAVAGEYAFALVNRLRGPMDFTLTVEFRAVSERVDPHTGRGYELP